MARTEQLFNVVREEEYVPKVWRVGDSVLLEKGGDWEDLNNYRGIMLQSCVGKLYGKVLGNRLGDAEAQGVHSDLQFAFREGRSAMEAVYILGEIIGAGVREGKGDRLAFLDIRKAYHRGWWGKCFGTRWGRLGLGVVRTSEVTMRGETIIRKAQVQAAVVRDEIRDGYDRIPEVKIIWEKISLPGILYGMEVADVEERVLEELEAIQVRPGRVILGVSHYDGWALMALMAKCFDD